MSPELIPVLLSTIFSILTIILCYYFLNDSFKNKLTLFISLLIISFDPNFLKHAFNGMETSFTYFLSYLILLGIIYSGKIKNNYFMGAIFGIFLLVRPESGLLSILTIIYLLFSRKIGLKGVIQILVSGLIIVLPWIIFTYLYMGKLLPDTFGAKGGDYTLGLNLFKNLISIARIFAGNYFPIFILALIFITKTPKFFKKEELKNMIIFLVVGMYILFYSVIFNNDIIYARYLCVIFPFFIMSFISFAEFSLPDVRKLNIALASVFMILLITGFTISRMDKVMVGNYSRTEKEIINWVNNNTSKDSYITRARIGEIGFKTQRRIFDLMGLINRDIAGYYNSNKITDYYLLKKPDYLIGVDDNIVESLKPFAQVNLLKEYKMDYRYLLRQKLSGSESRYDTIKVYKVDWFK